MSKHWNCIQEACTRENNRLAFRKTHFVPHHEGEYKLIRQTLEAVLSKETERQTEHVTGIVTSESAIEKIKTKPNLVQSGGY